jgi:DNA-binding MarR family transcriptional regulator
MTIERAAQVIQVAYPQVYLACHTRHQRKRTSVHRVSARDATILAHLQTGTATVPARLAEHLGIARSTLSEALKRLTALGYVERSAAKNGGVRLSAHGLGVIRRNSVLEAERLHAVLATLTVRERQAVVAGMRALAAGCERAVHARTGRTAGGASAASREEG